MGRMLGDAFVTISPDASGFRPSLDRQVKQAMAGLKYSVPIGLDVEGTMAAIRSLQQRMRSAGLADFLDVNIPVGRLITQLQVIKRLMNQAKVSDILEVNLDKASLAKAQSVISGLDASIPVSFDVTNLPVTGPLAGLPQDIHVKWDIPLLQPLADRAAAGVRETIPVNFDIGNLPVMGALSGLTEHVDTTAARESIAQLVSAANAGNDRLAILNGSLIQTGLDAALMARSLAGGNNALAIMGGDAAKAAASIALGRAAIAGLASTGEGATAAMQDMAARMAILDGSAMNFATATVAMNKSTAATLPLWALGSGALARFGGWFAFGTGKIQLFGGALTAMGVPLIGAISLWHLAIESLIEIAAVFIPATVAFAAFGAMAAPTAQHIYVQLQNIWTASNALNTSIYPLTASMQKLGDAVKPEVYQLFGEALVVVSKDAGALSVIAQQAGAVLVQLGARAAVALTSGGFGAFLAQGPADLAKISDIIANLFGTVGNLLRVLPGYAEILLTALDDVTKGIEAVTGSKLGEWLAASFLYFHGFIVWAGLAVTASIALGNGLLALGAKFGIVDAGMTVFNAEQFAQGLRLMLGGVVNLGAALVALDGAEAVAAVETGILAGAWAAISAVNPFVWIAVAVAGLTALAIWLSRSTSATDAYNTAVKNSLGQAPVTQLGVDLTASMATTTGLLAVAQAKLSTITEYTTTANVHLGTVTQSVTAAYAAQLAIVQGYQGELSTLQGYQANFNQLVKTAGGNLSFLSQAGITSNDIMTASAGTMKQYNVEVAAARAQTEAFANTTGRVGAVMNALNYTGDTTNNMLGSLDVDMAKVVQGQDALTNVILGGEQAFLSFQDAITGASAKLSTPAGLSGAASVAGASIGGLNAQSQALANSFYNDSLPAFQKMIDATEMQLISQSNLTKVVATGAAQMIPYVGQNVEARTAIVALVNNALGPGTVSLQTLNKWVAANSVSLTTMNGIIATSTINASALGKVLTAQLNVALANSILQAEGGGKALSTFATDLYLGTTQSNTFTRAAQQVVAILLQQSGNNVPAAQRAFNQYTAQLGLTQKQSQALWNNVTSVGIPALEHLGSTATNIKNNNLAPLGVGVDTVAGKVANLSKYLLAVPKNVSSQVTVHGSGTGGINIVPTPSGLPSGNARFTTLARGGLIRMGSGPTADDVPALVSRGETVVSAADSKKLAPAFAAMGVPGYAYGGIVGSKLPAIPGELGAIAAADAGQVMVEFAKAMVAKEEAALAAMGSGSSIVKYAESFLGKIPYVWGGTSLSRAGADCSGFTQSVYGHFGIHAPRTSEAQGAWVKRTGPQAGGLAFYHSPPGGPDPGHVAIVADALTAISQGGGMGPVLMGLHDMPLLWTGIPPGGFPGGSGGGATGGGVMSALAIEQLWDQMGGRPTAAGNMARIAMAESGDNPGAVQAGQPFGLTGMGLYQITPTSGISQNGAYGNLLNAANNTRAAISLYNSSGYLPWASDPVASALIASGITYAGGGIVGAGGGQRSTPQGFASGGLAGLLPGLAAAQKGEVLKYYGLGNSFKHGPAKYRTPGVMKGLSYLAARQETELADYAALSGTGGLTAANLRRLAGAAHQEASSAGAGWLSHMPGGHPLFARDLQGYLGQIVRLGYGSAGASGMNSSVASMFGQYLSAGSGTFAVSGPGGSETTWTGGSPAGLTAQSMDRGGWLRPGMNLVHNGLGRPEPVGAAAAQNVDITLHLDASAQQVISPGMLRALKYTVRVQGGGSVQKAFGNHEIKM